MQRMGREVELEKDAGSQIALYSPERVLIPKDYSLGPVFAASRQTGPREVVVNERRYQIGGFHPLNPDLHPPALDVRHARALFTLLSFRKPGVDSPEISFSFNVFCRKYAHSNGGRYAREITRIVADLIDSYIRITEMSTGRTHEYRLIERIDIEKRPPRRRDALAAKSRQMEIFFHGCTLSAEFYAVLSRITELQHLILDVFKSIRSPLAQAIYLYIPSRAYHHTEELPFEITITKLLEQVSFPVPAQKNRRRQLFTQNRLSIIRQLDGVETLKGIFRIRLAETADGTDWKIQTWVEKHARQLRRNPNNSKLMSIFLASGRTQEELDERLDNMEQLTNYEIDLLKKAEIDVEKDRRFLELAKALLGTARFVGIVGECKADTMEGRKATKNSTARLIWRIKEAMPARSATLPNHVSLRDGSELREMVARRDGEIS